MRPRDFVVAAIFAIVPAAAQAQVIYQPVQYQYQAGNQSFYYAGSNPNVFAHAQRSLGSDQSRYALQEGRYGVALIHRNLIGRPPQAVYSDAYPNRNAIVYGYTDTDARNDAYASVPRYYRMADLRGIPAADGMGVEVPATAPGTIDIRPTRRLTAPATRPSASPTPVLIIPKSLLEQPAKPPVKSVAVAQ